MGNVSDKRRGWGLAVCLFAPLLLASCTSKPATPTGSTAPSVPPSQGQVASSNQAQPASGDGAAVQSATGRQLPKGLKPIRMNLQGEELEQTCDALCAQIAEVIKSRNFASTEWTTNAERMFPQMKLVWRIFNGKATPQEIAADPESELVYKYLLKSDERIQYTLQSIASFVCWGRLDRVWFAVFDKPANSTMVEWGTCPLVGLPYVADASQVSCPQHGISFTFPDHTARPAIDRLMMQFVDGEFTAKRRHAMDSIILKNPNTAVKVGETVANIGCGVGADTLSIAEGVGPSGEVIATDINDDVLNFVEFVREEKGLKNISAYKVSNTDPGLRADTLDCAYMVDVFNYIAGQELLARQPLSARSERFLLKVCDALKPGGRLVIVDWRPNDSVPKLPAPVISSCLREMGLEEVEWHECMILDQPKFVLTMRKPLS